MNIMGTANDNNEIRICFVWYREWDLYWKQARASFPAQLERATLEADLIPLIQWRHPLLSESTLTEEMMVQSHEISFSFTDPLDQVMTSKRFLQYINSLQLSDTIWWHKSGSTLAQVMACCLTASSHYLDQCSFIINKVQWHSSECNFTRDASAIRHRN